MAFSPDGKLLVTGSAGGCVTVWNVASGQVVTRLRGVGGIASLAVSPQGLLAATEFWSGDVRMWDLASGEESPRLRGHPVMAWQVAFSPDGRMLASTSSDQKINLWDVTNRTLLASMVGHQSEIWSLAFSPDGKRLFTGSKDETIAVWPTTPERQIHSFTVASTRESPPLFSPDGLVVAAGVGSGEVPLQVSLWDVETAAAKMTLLDEKAALWFSPDAKVLATLSTNGEFHYWDLATRTIRRRVALSDNASPRGRTIVSKDGRVAAGLTLDDTRRGWVPKVYDVQSGLCRGELPTTIRSVISLDFSADGSMLAMGGDRMVELWDVHNSKLLRSLNAHKDGGPSVAFSPRGDILATGSVDNLVKLWSVPDGRMLAVLSGHREGVMGVSFSPDGSTLASAGADGWVKLWHLSTRREMASFKHVSTAWFVRFSPEGKTLAMAPGWGTMCLLRAPSLAEVDAQQALK
jgi:WD40 repeat protein